MARITRLFLIIVLLVGSCPWPQVADISLDGTVDLRDAIQAAQGLDAEGRGFSSRFRILVEAVTVVAGLQAAVVHPDEQQPVGNHETIAVSLDQHFLFSHFVLPQVQFAAAAAPVENIHGYKSISFPPDSPPPRLAA